MSLFLKGHDSKFIAGLNLFYYACCCVEMKNYRNISGFFCLCKMNQFISISLDSCNYMGSKFDSLLPFYHF